MLYNNKQQVVTLTLGQKMLCTQALEYPTAKNIKARQAILSPLRETKQQPNPCGRSTNDMFSIDQRAKFINYTAPKNTGLARSGRERYILTN